MGEGFYDIQKNILVQIETIVKGEKAKKALENIASEMGAIQESTKPFLAIQGNLNKLTQGYAQSLIDAVPPARTFGENLRNISQHMRKLTMSFLGVMFFGMMLQRTMFGLLEPALQATGMFELFQQVLVIFFLPIIEALLPYLLKLANWLINLPDSVKLAVGWFVLIVGVIGLFLSTIGSLLLGASSLLSLFLDFVSLGADIAGPIGAIVAAFIGVGGAVGIASMAMNFFNDVVKPVLNEALEGLGIKIPSINEMWDKFTTFISDLVDKHFPGFKEKIKSTLIEGLAEFLGLDASFKSFGDLFQALWDDKLKPIWDEFKGMFDKLKELVPSSFGEFSEALHALGTALEYLKPFLTILENAVDLMERYSEWSKDISTLGGRIPYMAGMSKSEIETYQANRPKYPSITSDMYAVNPPMGASITISQNINFMTPMTKEDVERMMAENNRNLVSQISSQINVSRG